MSRLRGEERAVTKLRVRSIAFGVSLSVLLGLLLLGATTWILGSKLVAPANHPVLPPSGFQVEVVAIPGQGHTIARWWIDSGSRSPVVLLLHAVRADRTSMMSRAKLLESHGFSVLLIDLQALGETPGDAITFGLRESKDVAAAREWIRQ